MFHVTFSLDRHPGQAVNSSNQEVIPMKPFTCSRLTPHKTPVVHRTLTLLPLLVLFLGFGAAFAQWGPDVRLTYDPANSTTQTQGSINTTWTIAPSGDTVHVIWLDGRGGTDNLEVWYKRSTNRGITWGTDTRLESDPLSLGSGDQCVAASGSTVHVVWARMYSPFDYRVFYKRSTDGGTTWGPEIQFTNPGEANGDPMVVASGPVVHVVWTFSTPTSQDIIYKRSTDGGTTWGPTAPIIEGWMSSMAVSGPNVHVVCLSRNVIYDFFYTHSTDGGTTWSPAVQLTNDPNTSICPSIAVPSQNRVHFTWEDDRDGHREIYYKRSTDGGTNWGPDTRLTYSPTLSEVACVAASGLNVHVVWYDWRSGGEATYYKRSTNGGTSWEPDTALIASVGWSWPSLALSGSTVHVAWTDNRDGNPEIYYKRNPTGNPTGVEENAEVRRQRLEVRFKATPNPFSSFATIPGHEGERFLLYDISGRLAGTFQGGRIGEGLGPGVYFLRQEGRDTKPLRIVKVR